MSKKTTKAKKTVEVEKEPQTSEVKDPKTEQKTVATKTIKVYDPEVGKVKEVKVN